MGLTHSNGLAKVQGGVKPHSYLLPAQAAELWASTGATGTANVSSSVTPGFHETPRLGKQFLLQHILLYRREMYTYHPRATVV